MLHIMDGTPLMTDEKRKLLDGQVEAIVAEAAKEDSSSFFDVINYCIAKLECAVSRRRTLTRMYSIGLEVSPGEYGMTDGPTPDVSEMIRVRGKEGDLLFELEGGRTVPLYRWNPSTGKWATIPATPSQAR